jgi:hypothetical protein
VDRELTYQVPYERLAKLGRSMRRQAYPVVWTRRWLLLGGFLAALLLLIVFEEPVNRWQASVGLPDFAAIAVLLVLFFSGVWLLQRSARSEAKSRADYDAIARMRQDDGGLRFMSDQIEYYVKWKGISQILLAHDGMAVSHGGLLFFVPDTAFNGLDERNAFIREIYARMEGQAKNRSEKRLASVLAESTGA